MPQIAHAYNISWPSKFSRYGLLMSSNTPIKNEKQKLTTREWIFIIIILLLIQFFIHWVSYQFGGSSNALGYVSFAGTLVSIMLGLIAIIYSFVQSISQSTNVIEIREQVERLMVAGGDISESGKVIHSASREVSELVGELVSKVTENTNATKEAFSSFKALAEDFNFVTAKESSGIDNDWDQSDSKRVRSVADSSRVLITVMVLCVRECVKRDYDIKQAREKLLPKLAIGLGLEIDFLSGAFHAVLFALEMEGLIVLAEDEGEEISIGATNGFNEKVAYLIPKTVDGDNKYFKGFWSVVGEIGA